MRGNSYPTLAMLIGVRRSWQSLQRVGLNGLTAQPETCDDCVTQQQLP